VLNGVLVLFRSPANYSHLRQHIRTDWNLGWKGWNPDLWDPIGWRDRDYNYLFFMDSAWDPGGSRWQALKRITIYTIVYLFLIVYFGFRFRTLTKPEKVIYLLMVYFTLIYASVDVLEANRMRMEYEVFFYFLALKFLWGRNPSTKIRSGS
jgi:hypothetical protein